MGSALETFNDFNLTTGPSIFTSPERVVNDAVKNSYLLKRFLRGKDPSVTIQGGNKIRDQIMFDESNTFGFTRPQETQTWENPQVLSEWEIPWRYGLDHKSWTAQEIEQNVTAGMTRTARHQQYKNLKRVKEQRMWTSMLNGMETHMFKAPETAAMEAGGGREPFNIPSMVNEQTDGLFYKSANVTGKTAWTTKQGIDPTQESKWAPQITTYSSASDAENDIHAAFDEEFWKVKFETPGTREEYFENDRMFRQFIACSREGIVRYSRKSREKQDEFAVGRQDPAFTRPQYSGIDLVYVAELDNAALYEAATSTDPLVTELADAGAANSGPRYYWLNGEYINYVFHTTRYMYMHKVKEHPNQHNTYIQPVDTWYNQSVRSLQRQGMVVPSGNVYS